MGDSHTYVDVVIQGEDHTFDLARTPVLSIGRHPQSSVVLADDPMVSPKHAWRSVRALSLDGPPRLVEALSG